jgi:hypothetical protein
MVGDFGLDSSGSGYGPLACPYKHSNKPLGSIEGGKFLECLSILLASKESLCSQELSSHHQHDLTARSI